MLLVAAFVLAPKAFFTRPFFLGAHRGGAKAVPENTAMAFRETAKRYPDILLETDVRLTKDGALVLLHDETVDRTTDGKGRIESLTLKEVRALDAGYRFSPDGRRFPYRGKGLRIATLAEALDAAPKHRFELDLKSAEVADKVADLLVSRNEVGRVLLASFVPAAMAKARERLPDAAFCYDFTNGLRLLTALRGPKWDAYQPEADVLSMMTEQVAQFRVTDDEIRRIRAKGIRFQIHTLDSPEEINRWRRVGVDSVLTDDPDTLAREAIGKPMARAHAHNDYRHPRPLLDALDLGFSSVEADIFLVDGELRVGHDQRDLVAGRTLERLYLNPLYARFRQYGAIHPWPGEFTLLVDVKEDGAKVVAELERRLRPYAAMLTRWVPARIAPAVANTMTLERSAVRVVISGDRPLGHFASYDARRYCFLDGRLSDTSLALRGWDPEDISPMLSDSYRNHFDWDGKGRMPEEQWQRLAALCDRVHRVGQKLRLWASPDTPEAWRDLTSAGVDYINTDRLGPLAEWLRENAP